MTAIVNVDGQNLYAHSLVPKGKDKAIEEMVKGGLAKGKDAKEKTAWAEKAWPLLTAKVASVELEAREAKAAAEQKRLGLNKGL